MKRIYLAIFVVCCVCLRASGQTIHVSSQTLSCTYPGPSVSDTISATGLTPASGYLVVDVPAKFMVSHNGSWDFSDTIAYTGGTLPPTEVAFQYGFSGSGWGTTTVSGGGASAEICVRGNNPPYQCTPASVRVVPDEASIIVSPNPSASDLTVSSTKTITSLTINDLVGKTVYAQQCNAKELKMNVANLPKGIYLLWINGTEVRKFIKD